jgi:hypothetical protein
MHSSTNYYSYLRAPKALKQLNYQVVKALQNGATAYKSID